MSPTPVDCGGYVFCKLSDHLTILIYAKTAQIHNVEKQYIIG